RRIDVSQLNELAPAQKQKLREWWKPQPGDFYCSPCNDGTLQPYGCYWWHNDEIERPTAIPLLDIGQMIEMLQEKQPDIAIERSLGIEYGWNTEHYRAFELADVLWIAVKEVLTHD
ncbi:MAG: hypothetical protein ABFD25_03215, partial [Clostridiaceae bacterium]